MCSFTSALTRLSSSSRWRQNQLAAIESNPKAAINKTALAAIGSRSESSLSMGLRGELFGTDFVVCNRSRTVNDLVTEPSAMRNPLSQSEKLSHVTPHERARIFKRLLSRFELRVPQCPSVNHLRPDFERYRHIGCTRSPGETDGIIKQCFRRPYLNERRRKSMQVREQWGNTRIGSRDAGGNVGLREFAEIGLVNERIDGVLGRDCCT